MDPRISVIIPTYNAARFAAEAIDSALGQTLAPLEVIVVDDGSTDDTERILRSYQDRIRVFRQPNSGVAAARNRGVRESRGNLIALLDHDDVWLSEKLEKQWECFQDHPDAGLVHTNFFRWREDTGEMSRNDRGHERSGQCYAKMLFSCNMIPSATLLKRECLDHVGSFDESIKPASTDDHDLFRRLARHYEFAYVEEPLVLYRLHASNASYNDPACLAGKITVIQKALREDPELARLVGRRNVADRLYELSFELGYLHHDAYRRREARACFRQALACRPLDVYALALYLANLMPSSWARPLRRLKARLC